MACKRGEILRFRARKIMWRLILFLSIFPPLIAWACRWWFGLRALAADGGRVCRVDLNRWFPQPGGDVVLRAEEPANSFGFYLRLHALEKWEQDDPKAAASRKSVQRFGLAVPPLSILIAAFAVLVGKITVIGAFAAVLGMLALACVFSLLALPKELRAVARVAMRLREARSFPRSDDEDAVIRCAIAHVWIDSLPPVLRWLQGGVRRRLGLPGND
jgi:hypothetical protein